MWLRVLAKITLLVGTQAINLTDPWSGFIPESIQQYSGTELVETTINYALYKNHTFLTSFIWHEVFWKVGERQRSLRERIQYPEMYEFLRAYYQKLSNETGMEQPSYHQLVKAADFNMIMIGGSVNASITRAKFGSFFEKFLTTTFKYAHRICEETALRTAQCFEVASRNKTLKWVQKKVHSRIEVVEEFCTRGLTSLGRYRVETCQLNIPYNGITMQEDEKQESCMKQYQCYVPINETKWNPWNISSPLLNSTEIVGKVTPKSIELIGFQPLISEYIRYAFSFERDKYVLYFVSNVIFTGTSMLEVYLHLIGTVQWMPVLAMLWLSSELLSVGFVFPEFYRKMLEAIAEVDVLDTLRVFSG